MLTRLKILFATLLFAAPALAQGVNPALKANSLASGAAAANIGAGGVTASMLASGAAAANLGAGGVTAYLLAPGAAASNLGVGGRVYNLRGDYGAACDGATDDTTPFNNALTALAGSTTPVTLTFPGTCLVTYAPHTIAGQLSFEGLAGGGVKLASGATMAGELFHWSSGTAAISVKNMTFDLNGATYSGVASVLYSGGGSFSVTGSSIANGAAPTVGTGIILVAGYNLSSCDISGNSFAQNAASIYQSQAINLGSSSYPVNHCRISHNVSKNTGFGIFWADNTEVSDNEIYGWGFGGGITLGPSDTNTHHISVYGNKVHDSATVVDVNNTYMNGIEQWFYGADVANNDIFNTCGSGIGVSGLSHIHGNTVRDPGTCGGNSYTRSGITTGQNGTETGNGSTIEGNVAFNTASGVMTYGYADTSSMKNIHLGVNDFQGTLGAYNIVGGADFMAAQKDNRLINPCGQIDQRNEGNAVTTGYVSDQWTSVESAGAISEQRVQSILAQCAYGMKFTVTSTRTPVSGDYFFVRQNIPYSDVADLRWEGAQGKGLIFSFCVAMSSAPPFTGSAVVINSNSGYTYPVSYTVTTAAGTPQCFSYRVPASTGHALGPTAGVALSAAFDTGSGTNNKTSTANAWVAGTYYGLTTASNFVSLPNATTMTISNVRLFPAAADQGWAPRSIAEELVLAQRYYRKSFPDGTKPAQNAGVAGATCSVAPVNSSYPFAWLSNAPPMFKTPTITTFNPSAANANWRDTTAAADLTVNVPSSGAGAPTAVGALIGASGTSATAGNVSCIHWTQDAGL